MNVFASMLLPIIDHHALLKKQNVMALWLDQELQEYMLQRSQAKAEAVKSDDAVSTVNQRIM